VGGEQGVKVSVKAEVNADGSVDCAIDCDGQKAVVTFDDGAITMTVPEAAGQ
jgi:hypothetical protein